MRAEGIRSLGNNVKIMSGIGGSCGGMKTRDKKGTFVVIGRRIKSFLVIANLLELVTRFPSVMSSI